MTPRNAQGRAAAVGSRTPRRACLDPTPGRPFSNDQHASRIRKTHAELPFPTWSSGAAHSNVFWTRNRSLCLLAAGPVNCDQGRVDLAPRRRHLKRCPARGEVGHLHERALALITVRSTGITRRVMLGG